MKLESQSIIQDINDFLKNHGIMTLAVANKGKPWVCTLYYGFDDSMNMYVVTDPNSRHGIIFNQNSQVSFNVFDSDQKITEPKTGVQGEGIISQVKGLKANFKALKLWHSANPGIETKITIKDILKKITDTKIYRITPTYLKFFNKQLYGDREYGEVT